LGKVSLFVFLVEPDTGFSLKTLNKICVNYPIYKKPFDILARRAELASIPGPMRLALI
jgi:hypothetical protein